MGNYILAFLVGFIACIGVVSKCDLVPVYEIDGVKTVHNEGHFYRLIEIDRQYHGQAK
jgi:hypothetical protein